MNNNYYPDMMLADIIQADYHLLLVLPRFGLDLGVGNMTVEQCCAAAGVSTDLFLTVCNVYSFSRFCPTRDMLDRLPPLQLVAYLKRSHGYYAERLDAIMEQLNCLSAKLQGSYCDLLSLFFADYRREVIRHFDYEENVVFPYVSAIATGQGGDDGYSMKKYEDNHGNIDDKLSDLINIVIKYLHINDAGNVKINLLFDIFRFEDDLSKHTHIENKILVPLVRSLER